jgi:hypothetical protein
VPQGWHRVQRSYNEWLKRQSEFSGKPIVAEEDRFYIEEYGLDDVRFDRFQNGTLGEVKGDFSFTERLSEESLQKVAERIQGEARNQVAVAKRHGLPLEWYVSKRMVNVLRTFTQGRSVH